MSSRNEPMEEGGRDCLLKKMTREWERGSDPRFNQYRERGTERIIIGKCEKKGGTGQRKM